VPETATPGHARGRNRASDFQNMLRCNTSGILKHCFDLRDVRLVA
jgi:hypothetical protein